MLRSPLAGAMIWYVDSRSGSDAKDGRSSDAAFRSVQRAILIAKPGDTILISPGLYDLDLDKQIGIGRGAGLIIAVTGGH